VPKVYRTIGVNISPELFAQFNEAALKAGFPHAGGWFKELGKRELNAPTLSKRSWGNLDAAERGATWKDLKDKGAVLPPEFSSWPAIERTKYLDRTFPL
jgi:hypothetical protein